LQEQRATPSNELSYRRYRFPFYRHGIRETQDVVEKHGIKKTFEKIEQAQVVLYLFDSLKFKVQSSEYIIEIEK
jgi:phenylalanyl-tRNA synthetase beta subunit